MKFIKNLIKILTKFRECFEEMLVKFFENLDIVIEENLLNFRRIII